MTIFPPKLKEGDSIYCTAPCAAIPNHYIKSACDFLVENNFNPVLSPYTLNDFDSNNNYFSASDSLRRQDLEEAFADQQIKAIWCLRGGYGASRIIDDINFTNFQLHPKWLIGFSDISIFQLHIATKFNISSLHAPMASYVAKSNVQDSKMMCALLLGEFGISIQNNTKHNHCKLGNAKGKLLGGNVSLVNHCIGTPSEPDWQDCILFLEEVDEQWYALERLLIQLKRADVFQKIKGLILGDFTNMKSTKRAFDKDFYQMIYDITSIYQFPIAFDFPFGHGERCAPLIQNAQYELQVSPTSAKLILLSQQA